MIVLPDAEDRTIICSFVWTKRRNVTDGRTDGQTDRETARSYCGGLHCEQCGHAVKMDSQTDKLTDAHVHTDNPTA